MKISTQPRKAPADVVDLFLECHERIRSFTGLAGRLAAAGDATPEDVVEAAARVRRYFAEALPLHVADEDDSVAPRLAGLDAEVDDALAVMAREHREHEEPLRALLALCGELAAAPRRAGELGGVVAVLEPAFAAHLEREERVVFPAIRRLLAPAQQAALLDEVRARRAR
jgi:iron-sulfur cluster repair protein YtfE (RIC family)